MTNAGLEQLKKDEGLRLKPYLCSAGKLTVGYGHVIQPHESVGMTGGISQERAESLLTEDINRATMGANLYVKSFRILSEARRDAIVNMVFNLGWMGFKEFHRFIDAVENENWNCAAVELRNSKWYGQVKNRADRIISAIKEG
jgi:lysozyme